MGKGIRRVGLMAAGVIAAACSSASPAAPEPISLQGHWLFTQALHLPPGLVCVEGCGEQWSLQLEQRGSDLWGSAIVSNGPSATLGYAAQGSVRGDELSIYLLNGHARYEPNLLLTGRIANRDIIFLAVNGEGTLMRFTRNGGPPWN